MLGVCGKSAQKAWSYAVVLMVLWSLFIVRKTILLFVLAVMFSYLLYPLVALVQRKITSGARFPALLIPFIGIPFLLLSIGLILRTPLINDLHNLRQQVQSDDFKNNLAQWHLLGIPIGEQIADAHNLGKIQAEVVAAMPQIRVILGRAGRDLSNVVLVPLLAFLMLKDGRQICDATMNMFFHSNSGMDVARRRRIVEGVLDDAHVLILEYMQALVVLCFAVLVVFSIALSVMKVRYGLLLALIAFPLEFVPLIGPLIAGVVIVGVCEFNHYPHIGWIITFLLAYRIFQDYVLSPYFMERSVKLHPLLIIFGVFAGGEIGGVSGIFLSVPLIALARLVFYEYMKRPVEMQGTVVSSSYEGEEERLAPTAIL